jgi:hypothetical protein
MWGCIAVQGRPSVRPARNSIRDVADSTVMRKRKWLFVNGYDLKIRAKMGQMHEYARLLY